MRIKNFLVITTVCIFFFQSGSKVKANLDDSIFVIKTTWPTNGQTNVPIDLKSGLTGSTYVNPPGIGNIAIGYGTDLSGGCGNPGHCPEIPDINMSSVNSSVITISSPNDPDIQIKSSGSGTCYGQCYNDDGFYYNFSMIPTKNGDSSGTRLKPNTTYTISVRSGSSGLSAHRTVNGVEKEVYLPSIYSWSFTTGDANSAAPIIIPPTSTPKNTLTTSRGSSFNYPTVTLIPTIGKKITVTPTTINKNITTPTNEPIVQSTETPSVASQNQIIEVKTTQPQNTWWGKIKFFFSSFFSKFNKQKDHSEIVSVTPTVTPLPTIIEEISTPTATPTMKPKPKPTVINKPVSVVDENVLRTKFGINSVDLITLILNDSGKLENYEREYYNQIKGWPELNTTAIEQRIFIPSINSTKICKTNNIVEIKNAVINVENLKGKSKSVLMKRSEAKPFIKVVFAEESLDKQIESFMKDYNIAKDTLNELITKYCR